MPGMKRKRTAASVRRRLFNTRPTKKRKVRFAGRAGIARVVSNMMSKKLEIKRSLYSGADYQQIGHNNFIFLDSTILSTNLGTADQMNTIGQRIGDEITLKGVSFKMMLEMNDRGGRQAAHSIRPHALVT
jgi:hypothetical protein